MTITKMLSIHIDALLPPTSAELDLHHSAQVAAILGVGLLYQGTAQRRMAEVLLSEIGDELMDFTHFFSSFIHFIICQWCSLFLR